MLRPSAVALASLKELSLNSITLLDSHAPVLAAMTSLTFLRLAATHVAYGASLVPAAVAGLASLKVLSLVPDCKAQLCGSDVNVLARLPGIEVLKILKRSRHRYGAVQKDMVWTCESMQVLFALTAKLSKLKIIIREGSVSGAEQNSQQVWSRE